MHRVLGTSARRNRRMHRVLRTCTRDSRETSRLLHELELASTLAREKLTKRRGMRTCTRKVYENLTVWTGFCSGVGGLRAVTRRVAACLGIYFTFVKNLLVSIGFLYVFVALRPRAAPVPSEHATMMENLV